MDCSQFILLTMKPFILWFEQELKVEVFYGKSVSENDDETA